MSKQFLAETTGMIPGTPEFQKAAYELCSVALAELPSLSLAFLDGRIVRVDPFPILSTYDEDEDWDLSRFRHLDGQLEVSGWRVKREVKRLLWESLRQFYTWESLSSFVFGKGMRSLRSDRAGKNWAKMRGLRDRLSLFEGAVLVIFEGEVPDRNMLAKTYRGQPFQQMSASKAARGPGRPQKKARIAEALKMLSPDRPIDATFSEIYPSLRPIVGHDFSDDTYSRAKKLAWPQNDDDE